MTSNLEKLFEEWDRRDAARKKIEDRFEDETNAREQACENCSHWSPGGFSDEGSCHRFPPTVLAIADQRSKNQRFVSVWPAVGPRDTCGEFVAHAQLRRAKFVEWVTVRKTLVELA